MRSEVTRFMESSDSGVHHAYSEKVPEAQDGQVLDGERSLDDSDRKLRRKIDFRLLPILCLLYLMAFLDRVNIANAAVYGLSKELKLTGNEFNVALTVFFVPYVLFELPSNIVLKQLRPHVWLSMCMFLFGFVTLMQGFVHNYNGLIATRFFLGLAEAGIFPGCFYLISMWYRRRDAQKRYTIFFSSTQLAGSFGGLIASAIGKMNGVRGYSAWRWIFIIEGALTCAVAFAAYFTVSDFPEEARWLSKRERARIITIIKDDQGASEVEGRVTLRDVIQVFGDYKVLLGGLMYFAFIVPAYGAAYFSPTIIASYGYSPIQTQLHSVPPTAAAFAFSLVIAYLSDRARHRYLFIMGPICIAVAGVGVLLNVHHNTRAEYAALFLVAMGTFSAMPVVICWFTLNLHGHRRRSIGTAWQIGFGNIAAIIATFSFQARDAPYYHTGYSILMAFYIVAAVASTAYFFACWTQNHARGVRKDGTVTEGNQDLRGGFRYLL